MPLHRRGQQHHRRPQPHFRPRRLPTGLSRLSSKSGNSRPPHHLQLRHRSHLRRLTRSRHPYLDPIPIHRMPKHLHQRRDHPRLDRRLLLALHLPHFGPALCCSAFSSGIGFPGTGTGAPPWHLRALMVATITAASGTSLLKRHLRFQNFSKPMSAPKPDSVT